MDIRFTPWLFACLLLGAGATAVAAADERPNCDLASPPAGFGEFVVATGVEGRVYPRLDAIPSGYAGCQVAWGWAVEGWQIVARVEYQNGFPVRLTAPDHDLVCEYRGGELVSGPADACFDYERLYFRSYPQGCLASYFQTRTFAETCKLD